MLLFKEKVEKIPVLIVVWIYAHINLWMYKKNNTHWNVVLLTCMCTTWSSLIYFFSHSILEFPEFILFLFLYFTHLLLTFIFFPHFKIGGRQWEAYYKVELKNEVNSGRNLFCCTNVCHSIQLLAWMTECNWAFWICRNNWFICSLWRYNLVIRREKKCYEWL